MDEPQSVAVSRNPFTMKVIAIILGIIIVLGGGAAMYWFGFRNMAPAPAVPTTGIVPSDTVAPVDSSASDGSLGANIYDQSQNPIDGKVPASDPVPNPVGDLYQNPFQ